jgi:hypothetical protein
MKLKKLVKEVLKDPKHWFGWVLSAIAILIAIKVLIFTSPTIGLDVLFLFFIIFIAEVIVDLFKHLTELQ